MPFIVPIGQAKAEYPEYTFIRALTPSAQKAAFHVQDLNGLDLCLKIISPDYDIDRVMREIKSLQEIDHLNVVKLLGYTQSVHASGEKHFMVEEYIDGQDLSELFRTGPISRPDAARLFIGIASGLSALAEHSIVHRDLKPSNIRVSPDGTPVIIDFGVARLLTYPDLTRTANGAAIGTVPYFSPEQCKGNKHDIDHRTDLFAFGILLYQGLLGQHPFCRAGMTDDEMKDAICHSQDCFVQPSFRALPDRWKILLIKLLNKERALRPRRAHQVAAILTNIGAM